MALVYLRSLLSVFVYFLHITLFSLKTKNLSLKSRMNHQKDVTCFRSDDEKTLYNKIIQYNNTDYNNWGHRNIFRIKSSKCKTAKNIPRYHGYHKTCRWNLWRSAGERLCSLQKMDQRVIQQKIYGPLRTIKLTQHHSKGCGVLPTHADAVLLFNG